MLVRFYLSNRYLVCLGLACGLALGCGRNEPTYKPQGEPKTKFAMRLGMEQPFPGGKEFVPPKGKEIFVLGIAVDRLFVSDDAVLANEHVMGTSISPTEDESGKWQVHIFLTPVGRERLARVTRENKPVGFLALFFDDQYEMAPTFSAEINDRVIPMGPYDKAKADALARKLVGQ